MISEKEQQDKKYYYINDRGLNFMDIAIKIMFIIISFYFGTQIIKIKVEEQSKLVELFFSTSMEIIIIQYICIAFHEIEHVLFLKFYKYDFRSVIVGPIVLDNNKKYCLKLSKSRAFITGLTITKIGNFLKNKNDYLAFKSNFKKILFGGICINIILIISGLVLLNFNDLIHIGYILIYINVSMIITSIFKNGDIDVIRNLKRNQDKVCLFLVGEFDFEKEINVIVEKEVMNYINIRLLRKEYDLDMLIAVNIILRNKNKIQENNLVEIYKFLEWFKSEYTNILKNDNIVLRLKSEALMKTASGLQF